MYSLSDSFGFFQFQVKLMQWGSLKIFTKSQSRSFIILRYFLPPVSPLKMPIDIDFLELARDYTGISTPRQFNAHFGVPLDSIQRVWRFVSHTGLSPTNLLITLYFFKVYPVEDVGCNVWRMTAKIYRGKIRNGIKKLGENLPPV